MKNDKKLVEFEKKFHYPEKTKCFFLGPAGLKGVPVVLGAMVIVVLQGSGMFLHKKTCF